MMQKIKRFFYFVAAWYFRIFAEIKLRRWNPRIMVVMGSSGKTTLLHMLESQIGSIAKYSHHANSSIGIPFDILGIKRNTLTLDEWPKLILAAPLKAFSKVPKEKIYVVEADCDRPYEGNFLSSLLSPEVTLWTNVSKTHSMNFDSLVDGNEFRSIEKAIAYEFGHFLVRTKKLVILNADNAFVVEESKRATCEIQKISNKDFISYKVGNSGTIFDFGFGSVKFKYLLPVESSVSVLMCKSVCKYLGLPFDPGFSKFILPPGRSSIFRGIKGTTIVDSAYNANLDSMKAIIRMFAAIKANEKWAVLGDMLEQGKEESEEHEKLAKIISDQSFDRVILLGPRVSKYTYPILGEKNVAVFENPKDVLLYLQKNIKGNEYILFKGARFLEGVIENLLADKKDVANLDRREKIWEARRKKWGL
jgi:UDP-N-acetylmuramoyl-tripeptide--D-alanyl-D-alanine ligase